MQYKTLSVLLLSASALAAPSPQKTQTLEEIPDYDEYVASLSAAASETDLAFPMPTEDIGVPSSILAVLETAMPLSFISQIADPAGASAVDKAWSNSEYPEWYTDLPSDVKEYFSSVYQDLEPATNSAEATGSSTDKGTATGSASATATATGTTTATGTADASSSAAQSSGVQTTGSQTTGSSSASGTSAAETTGSQGATSEGGAPAPTAMAASLAGAAGILGLAFAL